MVNETAAPDSPLLRVKGLCKSFKTGGILGPQGRVIAAQDVSFDLRRGEAVALVGESGSGKSTVAKLLLRLEKPDAGEIHLDGREVLAAEPRNASLDYRGRVQMVFQDPFGSLNPVHNIAHHLIRPLLRHRRATSGDARQKALELLSIAGLEPAQDFINRHPYELSGGQRQRVAIARALAVEPDLLIADEPTSMLDVSIRMGVLQLLARLKTEQKLGILLITHDLASARYLADRVLVLFRGRIVEDGPTEEVIRDPQHPYTRALLACIADSEGPRGEAPVRPESDAPMAEGGCPFAPRCPDVMDVCLREDPAPLNVDGRNTRCHLYGEHAAQGQTSSGGTP
ncbi:MAG: ABC transporter ATP-binding protein [Gemmatimonadetes bacterium]|nr:ABC transporter ATP-binding protein [Gemmatimonadota bacterium]